MLRSKWHIYITTIPPRFKIMKNMTGRVYESEVADICRELVIDRNDRVIAHELIASMTAHIKPQQ